MITGLNVLVLVKYRLSFAFVLIDFLFQACTSLSKSCLLCLDSHRIYSDIYDIDEFIGLYFRYILSEVTLTSELQELIETQVESSKSLHLLL